MTKSPLRLTVLDKCKDLFYNLNLHVIKAGLFFFPFSYGEKFIAWHNSWCGGKNCNALSIYSKPQEFLRPQPNFRDKKAVVCEGWAWLLGSKSLSSLSVLEEELLHGFLIMVTQDRVSGASKLCGAFNSFWAQAYPLWIHLCTCCLIYSYFCYSVWLHHCKTFPPLCGSEKGIGERTWKFVSKES